MITSLVGLQRARARWLGAGRDPELFDLAVNVLECATTNLDVRQALSPPTYCISNRGGTDSGRNDVWGIYANGELMLEYRLLEVSYSTDVDADVTVFS